MDSKEIFGKHQFVAEKSTFFNLENYHFGIKREKEGWAILLSDNKKELTEEMKDFSKGEYFQTGKSNTLVISPALPEKPLVFKGNLLRILPKHRFTFFLKIPLTIQIYHTKNQAENLLKEFSGKRLSGTWFGDPDAGEPALALGNQYELNFDNLKTEPLEAICPVSVYNNSSHILELQRLIIRVENLTLYKNADKVVTSVVQVEYKGQDAAGSAEYHFSKTYDGEKQEILAKPRNSGGKSAMKINFHFMKNIYRIE